SALQRRVCNGRRRANGRRARVARRSGFARALPNPVKEVTRWDLQPARKPHDRGEAGLTSSAFEKRDLSSMEIACVAQRLLRQAGTLPRPPQIPRKPFSGLHAADARELRTKRL